MPSDNDPISRSAAKKLAIQTVLDAYLHGKWETQLEFLMAVLESLAAALDSLPASEADGRWEKLREHVQYLADCDGLIPTQRAVYQSVGGEMDRLAATSPPAAEGAERPAAEVKCFDCGLPYGSRAWVDAVIPHDVWAKIAPINKEAGVLCFNCIAGRLTALGLENVPVHLGSGPMIPGDISNSGPAAQLRGEG